MRDKSPSYPVVFTSNRLRDGRVAWLGQGSDWVADIAAAQPFPPETAARGLALAKAAEARQLVVGIYAVELAEPGRPLRFREQLRAAGPSVA